MDLETLKREADWRRCARDENYFLETYWFIRVPGQGRVLLSLRKAQKLTLRDWRRNRYTITLKARQIGFSTIAAGHAVWLTMFQPEYRVIMLSKGEREAQSLLRKSKYGFEQLPAWMRARAPQTISNNLSKLEFDNGSCVESLPSGSDPARGEAVDLVIVDEWAFLPNPEDAWASIEPITDVGGRVIGISTANGSGNFFHRFYNEAKTGVSAFKAIFHPWDAHSGRDRQWYAAKAAMMPEHKLHQEYPRDDVECFTKSGNPVYDTDMLGRLDTLEPARGELVEVGPGQRVFRPDINGLLAIWEEPVPNKQYVIGGDTAEGLDHGDYSVAHVIRYDTGLVVAKWRGHIDPDLFGKQILAGLGYWYNTALVGPEANNHGHTVVSALKNCDYPWIYQSTTYTEHTEKTHKRLGWWTNSTTKPMMIDELGKALRDSEITLLDHETIAELTTYVRDPNGKMHGSPHDDQVMSLAIANQMMKHSWDPTEPIHTTGWAHTFDAAVQAITGKKTSKQRVGASNRR